MLFIEHGFDKVSTTSLAKEAKISKSTLYNRFGNMQGVLDAIMATEEAKIEKNVPLNAKSMEEFIASLEKLGCNLLHFLNEPHVAKLDNMFAERSRDNPKSGVRFFAQSYQQTLNIIHTILENAKLNGFLLPSVDTDLLAEVLLAGWEGFGHTKARFSVVKVPYEQVESRIKAVNKLLISPLVVDAV
ncbi:TetR/AcrR family transcriptional regulator [Glaciecola siphonariae]|uniref:TetR/AcrR family transcriptional regulator n=1 Tax=Glaciecola siphonariae TaxID=521012 RepID=A0ABV9LRA6_9ALTE